MKEYIDPNAPGGKEHIGYIVDRTGFEEFKRVGLAGCHPAGYRRSYDTHVLEGCEVLICAGKIEKLWAKKSK